MRATHQADASTIAQPSIDLFVDMAHWEPTAAIAALDRHRLLATATSSWGETAIQAASQLGHRDLIIRLVECGARLDVFAAAALADLRAVKRLMAGEPRHRCGVHDLPLLHFAVMSRDPEMVGSVIAAGAPLAPRGASLSPLHSAVSIGSKQMVRILVAAGADVTSTDAFGQTALDWAYDLCVTDAEMLELLGRPNFSAARRTA